MITLSQAKALVQYLEDEDQNAADTMLAQLFAKANEPMFNEIGKLTREIHNSILDVQLNPKISHLAQTEIPNAKESLSYVLEKTEAAVNRTMNAVDIIAPITQSMHDLLSQVSNELNELIEGQVERTSLASMHQEITLLLEKINRQGNTLHFQLSEILMAQEFQDLTGQVIYQIMALFKDIEVNLVQILTSFGSFTQHNASLEESKDKTAGPVVNKEQRMQKQVLESQDEVDELLKSLGF